MHLVAFANYSPVSDRYLYAASAGFCLLAAGALARPPGRYLLWVVLLGWGVLTIRRNGLYRDERGLYEASAACAPRNAQAQALLGDYRLTQNEFGKLVSN